MPLFVQNVKLCQFGFFIKSSYIKALEVDKQDFEIFVVVQSIGEYTASKGKIKRLFPEYSIQVRSLTLAPSISRRVAPVSPLPAHVLECLFPFLRTHAVYVLERMAQRA